MITYEEHLEFQANNTSEESAEKWLKSMSDDERLKWIVLAREGYPLKEPKPNKNLYEHIDIENMIFGQFMMIEMVINSDIKPIDKYKGILPYILRPSPDVFSNDNPEVEEELMKTIKRSDAAYIESVLDRFLKHRDDILHKKYNGVIYGAKNDDSDEEGYAV